MSGSTPFQLNDKFVRLVHDRLTSTAFEMRRAVNGIVMPLVSAALPSREHLAEMIAAVFWASVTKEEDQNSPVGLVYCDPREAIGQTFYFEEPFALHASQLAKMAPAVRRHFGAWPDADGALAVWGFSSSVYGLATVYAPEPGRVMIGGFPRVVAVVSGDEARTTDAMRIGPGAACWPAWIRDAALEEAVRDTWILGVCTLARAMRSHGRGGICLLVPRGGAYMGSLDSAGYRSSKPYDHGKVSYLKVIKALRQIERRHAVGPGGSSHRYSGEGETAMAAAERFRATLMYRSTPTSSGFISAIEDLAQLTAVDGALVLTNEFNCAAFGAKIRRHATKADAPRVLLDPVGVPVPSRPPERREGTLEELGGTRHTSPGLFVAEQRDAFAVVVSEDGRVSFLSWDDRRECVYALLHVERLL